MAPSGIEPAAFRLVTQCLNQLRRRIAQTVLLVLFSVTNIKDKSGDGTQVDEKAFQSLQSTLAFVKSDWLACVANSLSSGRDLTVGVVFTSYSTNS
jgi:hypothetical protein